MTTQRQKDLCAALDKYMGITPTPSPAIFADGAAYGRKDGYDTGWVEGRKALLDRMRIALHREYSLEDLLEELEADE